jgi:hypothetical protein
MSIWKAMFRIAQGIVIGIATLGVAASIYYGKAGEIPDILFGTVYYVLLVELLWRFCRAVIVDGIKIEFRPRTSHSTSYVHNDDDSSRDWNQETLGHSGYGLPMIGATDAGGHHWYDRD